MFGFLPQRLSRFAFVALFALAATVAVTDGVLAATRVLSGTHSFGSIAAACGANGGTMTVHASGGYGCVGKGGSVDCNASGKCTGGCNSSSKCASVVKALNGGERPPSSSSAGNASASGTANSDKHPITNANQPVAVGRVGAGHSGGGKH